MVFPMHDLFGTDRIRHWLHTTFASYFRLVEQGRKVSRSWTTALVLTFQSSMVVRCLQPAYLGATGLLDVAHFPRRSDDRSSFPVWSLKGKYDNGKIAHKKRFLSSRVEGFPRSGISTF